MKKPLKTVLAPSDGRETTASDILEASEIVRAALTLLRVASGVTFFAGQYTGEVDYYSEARMKVIGERFDAVADVLQTLYGKLINAYHAASDQSANS